MDVAGCAPVRKFLYLAYAVVIHQEDFGPDYVSRKQEQRAISA